MSFEDYVYGFILIFVLGPVYYVLFRGPVIELNRRMRGWLPFTVFLVVVLCLFATVDSSPVSEQEKARGMVVCYDSFSLEVSVPDDEVGFVVGYDADKNGEWDSVKIKEVSYSRIEVNGPWAVYPDWPDGFQPPPSWRPRYTPEEIMMIQWGIRILDKAYYGIGPSRWS